MAVDITNLLCLCFTSALRCCPQHLHSAAFFFFLSFFLGASSSFYSSSSSPRLFFLSFFFLSFFFFSFFKMGSPFSSRLTSRRIDLANLVTGKATQNFQRGRIKILRQVVSQESCRDWCKWLIRIVQVPLLSTPLWVEQGLAAVFRRQLVGQLLP